MEDPGQRDRPLDHGLTAEEPRVRRRFHEVVVTGQGDRRDVRIEQLADGEPHRERVDEPRGLLGAVTAADP
jgi:hypothetical protein